MSEEKREILVKTNFPSNSHTKAKEEVKDKEERVKVQKVVSGKVVQKKKSLGRKFMETFVGEDVKNIKSYVIEDVAIPAAKDMFADIVQGITDTILGSVEVALFGEARRRGSRSRRGSRDKDKSYFSYNSISNRDRDRDRKDDRRGREKREISSRNRSSHNFDDIVLETRGDAEEVLNNLVDLIIDYGEATVAALYDLVGITEEYTDRNYGWTNLSSASVSRTRDGYMLNLPKPILLD